MKKLSFPISPEDYDKIVAKKTFNLFSQKEGSLHIASEFALSHLSAILTQMHGAIGSVLEIGAGIGTITHLLLTHKYAPKIINITENNAFCLEQLSGNIPTQRVCIYNNLHEIAAHIKYDLIIVDGSFREEELSNFFHDRTIFFIEGNRKHAADAITEMAKSNGLKIGFDNIIQGRKIIHFDRKKKKLKFFKKIKGCRVGKMYK